MLLKTQRLSRAEFSVLLKSGQRFFAPTLCAVWLRVPDAAPKAGVVVSKKVARLSVARHRLRRQVYCAVRPHMQDLNGVHIAIILKKQGEHVGFATLMRDVASVVEKITGAHRTNSVRLSRT